MKNLPIIGKLFAIIALLALFCVGATALATKQMHVIDNDYSDLVQHLGTANVALAQGGRALASMQTKIGELIIARTDDNKNKAADAFTVERSEFIALMDASVTDLPSHGAKFDTLKQKGLQAVDQACADTIAFGKARDAEAVLKSRAVYTKDCGPAIAEASAGIRTALRDLLDEAKSGNEATSTLANATIRLTWGLTLGGLLLVVAAGAFAVRTWITKPLAALAGSMSTLADGNYNAQVPGLDRRDEIGMLARVGNAFKTTGIEKIAVEQRAAQERLLVERERAQEAAAQAARSKQQAQIVEALAGGLACLAEGDLVFRLEQAFAPEYEKLRADFNSAVAKLRDTMTVITEMAAAIRSGTAEVSTAADDLSRRTEQQAASLEETAAALDEITATVKKTSEGSSHARQVVSTAKADAEESGRVVGRAVQAMSAIEASSEKIGQIIGVIDEIAFQTNLLALNAGVEAARAGEAGRGFAVVASEVRALAQRSAEAAKEIKALISTSSQQVGMGVDLVNETGDALKRIAMRVIEINVIVAEIAASASEQSTGLGEVNTAVNQMDQVTQQNAAMVEESTAASKSLAQEAGELARLVGQFRLGADGSSRKQRDANHGAASPSTRTIKALKATGTGGAARKQHPQADVEWEEF